MTHPYRDTPRLPPEVEGYMKTLIEQAGLNLRFQENLPQSDQASFIRVSAKDAQVIVTIAPPPADFPDSGLVVAFIRGEEALHQSPQKYNILPAFVLDNVGSALWMIAFGDKPSAIAARCALRDKDPSAVDRIPGYLTLDMQARTQKLTEAVRRRPGTANVPHEICAAVALADAWAKEAVG